MRFGTTAARRIIRVGPSRMLTSYAGVIVAASLAVALSGSYSAQSLAVEDAGLVWGLFVADIAYAQEQQPSVTASALIHGLSSIVTITNPEAGSSGSITTVRMWLSPTDEATFKSFKTESGWTGQKTPHGVVIFTTTTPVQPGESVKFGIETDVPISGINWRAIGSDGGDLGIGQAVPAEITDQTPPPTQPPPTQPPPTQPPPTQPPPTQPPPTPEQPITSESDFRIIPVKPSVGSTIRIAGEKFGPEMRFDFYINNRVLTGIESRADGTFVATASIPPDILPDRVSFVIKNAEGQEVVRSLRLSPAEQRPGPSEHQQQQPGSGTSQSYTLRLSEIPGTAEIGDRFPISGTGKPGGTVVVYTTDPSGIQVSADVVVADGSGAWSIPGTYLVGADMEIGQYVTRATDGIQTASASWSVTTRDTISIQTSKIKYERGDSMRFNITTTDRDAQGEPISVKLEDPNNMVIYSDILETNGSRSAIFEYNTTYSSIEGTYTLVVSHGKHKEYSFAGIGETPNIKIRFDLDKVNYRSNDVAIVDIKAKPGDSLRFNILDKSDRIINENHRNRFVNVQSDGRASIALDLIELENGIFTAELEKGTEKVSKEFTVGLQSGATNIDIIPIKPPYNVGDQFLVSIDTGHTSVPLTITMTDPDGKTVTTKESFSRVADRKDRSNALETMLIPSSGKLGTWNIVVSSGGNTFSVPVEVIPEGMSIQILGINEDSITRIGKYIDVMVSGAEQTVWIGMTSQDGTVIVEEQRVSITSDNVASTKIVIPGDTVSGTYVLKARDTYNNTAEIEITIE